MFRLDVKFKIEKLVKMKRSVLLLGPNGIGKTYILKHLNGIYVEHASAKQILGAIIKHYKINISGYRTIPEQIDAVKPYLHKSILLIDNCDDVYKPTRRLIENLISYGAVIIAASKRKQYFCSNMIRLEELSKKESFKMLSSVLPDAEDIVHKIIVNKSHGNPGKITELAKDYILGIKTLEFNPFDKSSTIDFFLKLKPQIPERINIFPVWLLFVLGFGALTIKVIMYSQGDFKDAYMIAAFGYTSLIIYRLFQKRKY